MFTTGVSRHHNKWVHQHSNKEQVANKSSNRGLPDDGLSRMPADIHRKVLTSRVTNIQRSQNITFTHDAAVWLQRLEQEENKMYLRVLKVLTYHNDTHKQADPAPLLPLKEKGQGSLYFNFLKFHSVCFIAWVSQMCSALRFTSSISYISTEV